MGYIGSPCTPPGQDETDFFLFLGYPWSWKMGAAVTKLGWTTCVTSFSKWPPRNYQKYVSARNSASRIDRDNILVTKSMFSRMLNPMVALTTPWRTSFDHNPRWPPPEPVKIRFPPVFWHIGQVQSPWSSNHENNSKAMLNLEMKIEPSLGCWFAGAHYEKWFPKWPRGNQRNHFFCLELGFSDR